MKRRETRFTLIELLVVIGIIAVLAGILLPTISIAIKKAHITTARTEMTSLMSAITMYQTEYDVMPFAYDSTQDSKALSSSDYDVLISFLSQTGTTADKAAGNARKVKMLNVKKDATYLDPWDHRYNIVYDCNYNERVTDGTIVGFYATSPATTFPYTIVIWSAGPDEKFNSTTPSNSTNKDNIYTVETNWDNNKGHVVP